ALSKKSKRPMSKKPPTETKVIPPKPTECSEQSHSVSSGTVPNNQGTGVKYQEDQTQSSRLRYQSLIENEGEPSYKREPNTQPMLLTYADVRAILLSEHEAQESEEDILGAGEEMDDNP
nr:hypothetical protein [Tanacetum cinerariifolium]